MKKEKNKFTVSEEKAKEVQKALKELKNDTLNDLSAEFISGGEWTKSVTIFKNGVQ